MFSKNLDETRDDFEAAMMNRYRIERRAFAKIVTAEGKEHYAYPYVNNWWSGWKEALRYVEENRQENQR